MASRPGASFYPETNAPICPLCKIPLISGDEVARRAPESNTHQLCWQTRLRELRGPCTGASDCPVLVHEHGCYADLGSCNHPEEHRDEVPDGQE